MTRTFPSDLDDTLKAHADLTIEMTTAPGCLPCGDLWTRLIRFSSTYGWRVRIISRDEGLLRSGRLGLPWVGHPVLWVRPTRDESRTIPVAIGTDHDVNLRRNIYLAAKMFDGVRPAVGLRAMSKFTGIVAPGGARTIISKPEGH
ncbi:hypothetical protein [Sphingobium sp. AN558]